MDIYEALDKMSAIFTHLAEYWGPDATDEELEEMGQVEDTICQFIESHIVREEVD